VGKVPDSPDNEAACLCADCPSKTEDGLGFYCVRGESPMTVSRGFCACSWCPLWSGYGLTKTFFCDEGADEDEPTGGEDAADDRSLAGAEEVT
jgi:Protein of unknown function (DUF2769)